MDHESSAVISWASAVKSKPLGTQAAPVCGGECLYPKR